MSEIISRNCTRKPEKISVKDRYLKRAGVFLDGVFYRNGADTRLRMVLRVIHP
jgi:hypothetical protein